MLPCKRKYNISGQLRKVKALDHLQFMRLGCPYSPGSDLCLSVPKTPAAATMHAWLAGIVSSPLS